MPTDPVDSSPVVEVLVSGPGFSDLERFEVADDRSARTFARDVMDFALHPERRKRRGRTGSPAAAEPKE